MGKYTTLFLFALISTNYAQDCSVQNLHPDDYPYTTQDGIVISLSTNAGTWHVAYTSCGISTPADASYLGVDGDWVQYDFSRPVMGDMIFRITASGNGEQYAFTSNMGPVSVKSVEGGCMGAISGNEIEANPGVMDAGSITTIDMPEGTEWVRITQSGAHGGSMFIMSGCLTTVQESVATPAPSVSPTVSTTTLTPTSNPTTTTTVLETTTEVADCSVDSLHPSEYPYTTADGNVISLSTNALTYDNEWTSCGLTTPAGATYLRDDGHWVQFDFTKVVRGDMTFRITASGHGEQYTFTSNHGPVEVKSVSGGCMGEIGFNMIESNEGISDGGSMTTIHMAEGTEWVRITQTGADAGSLFIMSGCLRTVETAEPVSTTEPTTTVQTTPVPTTPVPTTQVEEFCESGIFEAITDCLEDSQCQAICSEGDGHLCPQNACSCVTFEEHTGYCCGGACHNDYDEMYRANFHSGYRFEFTDREAIQWDRTLEGCRQVCHELGHKCEAFTVEDDQRCDIISGFQYMEPAAACETCVVKNAGQHWASDYIRTEEPIESTNAVRRLLRESKH